jgi:hypothetical protein
MGGCLAVMHAMHKGKVQGECQEKVPEKLRNLTLET